MFLTRVEVIMTKRSESISYLVLFCAMLVAQKNRATWEEASQFVALPGNAGLLAREMSKQLLTAAP